MVSRWPGERLVVFLSQASEIPSFYIILHLALVWHDLLDPIIFFRQRGFHRAVTALAATGFVVLRIESG